MAENIRASKKCFIRSMRGKVLRFSFFVWIASLMLLFISDMFSLAILVFSNSGQVAHDLFSENILVPLTIVVAVAYTVSRSDNLYYLISSFSLLYLCSFYIYIYYNIPMVEKEVFGYIILEEGGFWNHYISLMAEVNKFGLVIGIFGVMGSLFQFAIDKSMSDFSSWVKKW